MNTRRRLGAAALTAMLCTLGHGARAYTAAGDRLFPATILLPQIAPSDDAYLTTSTQPLRSETIPGSTDRLTNVTGAFNKTITERFSIGVEDGWNRFDPAGASSASGWQNFETSAKYLAVQDDTHELLVSLGVDREWGGTGAAGIGASAKGATTPAVFLGKGMGDLDVDVLKPFAIAATFGYQAADAAPRPNLLVAGLTIEYSIPYFESKVRALALPDFMRAMTPMVEFFVTTPSGSPRGSVTTATIAPGVNYAAEGWELGVEALVPATRSAGRGVGVIAQLHFALDYLFPDSIGKPIFSRH